MILLADDNRDLREALAEQLRRRGFAVVEAADGLSALQLATERLDQLQALVTDFEMPGLDGLSLAGKLRQDRQDLRVLLITSRLPGELPSGSSAVDVLMKPFDAVEVERWLKTKASQRPAEMDVGLGEGTNREADRPSRILESKRRSQQREDTGWGLAKSAALVVSTALLCLVLIGLKSWLSPPESSELAIASTLPAPPEDDPTRSATIEGLQPLGVMATPPRRFTWEPVPGAAGYRVLLTDVTEHVLWSLRTADPDALVPPKLRDEWRSHTAFYLTVRAFDAEGRPLASSTGGRLRVVPPSPSSSEPTDYELQGSELQGSELQGSELQGSSESQELEYDV